MTEADRKSRAERVAPVIRRLAETDVGVAMGVAEYLAGYVDYPAMLEWIIAGLAEQKQCQRETLTKAAAMSPETFMGYAIQYVDGPKDENEYILAPFPPVDSDAQPRLDPLPADAHQPQSR